MFHLHVLFVKYASLQRQCECGDKGFIEKLNLLSPQPCKTELSQCDY